MDPFRAHFPAKGPSGSPLPLSNQRIWWGGDLGQDDTKKLKRYLVSLQSTTLRARGDLSPPACFEWED